MKRKELKYRTYVQILKEELVKAMGCTEPIALSYAAAKARELLGEIPVQVEVEVSGNIIKNVKSVIVPNTGHLKGIEAAIAAGIIAGKAEKKLEVLSEVNENQKKEIEQFLKECPIIVKAAEGSRIFYICVRVYGKVSKAEVRIADAHTHIVYMEKDGKVLFQLEENEWGENPLSQSKENEFLEGAEKTVLKKKEDIKEGDGQKTFTAERSLLNIEDILDFANTLEIEDVEEVIGQQILCNTKIAEEGLKNKYGANIGRIILENYGNDVKNRAKAMAAAGSDARMNGCELPVVIVSGSGNQGITASLPVLAYAKELGVSKDKLYRALVISNLVTIHQKTGIGKLSAYCGAVCAGSGCGAGIAYLYGGGYEEISHTIVNALAIVSGIVCDGAKASCAAKIAAAVDAGILGYHMYQAGQQFFGGDGIVTKGVENTIANIGRLAKEGMKETDKEIIKIMVGES